MHKILVVVDMQNDFIDGALGSEEAKKIVPNVIKKINEYRDNDNIVICTFDTHFEDYLNTQEGNKLPVEHCIFGTYGHRYNQDVMDALIECDKAIPVVKHTFGSLELIDRIEKIRTHILKCDKDELEIELVGLCEDICVANNAFVLKAAYPDGNIIVDLDCTAATSKDTAKASEILFESCQIDMVGERS